ncbi:redoxin family protein [Gloeobacter kilaueensis]|uniref:Thiol-disulfide oxidoreductase n=1 Tax=Gloeobacter kilaueensis (strain ATCC BAA-2537 / CCAP 1431/1 / ULC 316 / JS1) TaxID=1183438 RepID=U5QQB5_GLOK1|nr:redoxin family protein [Gloeobacter kilaueensis]AGY59865.1 thiol-disulfide oxidoreductase [Gloeobacter kilaueensis JS1]
MQPLSRRKILEGGLLGAAAGAGLLALAGRALALDNGKPLPEFQGIETWLGGEATTVEAQRGRVVAVHIWTFACINCQRTLPSVIDLHRKYAAQGLTIIGVHTPEFAYEHDIGNIRAAIARHGIPYRVAVDNEYKTWRAYDNEYWPHLFIADRGGRLRYDHIGEGAYERNEQVVRQLLAEKA